MLKVQRNIEVVSSAIVFITGVCMCVCWYRGDEVVVINTSLGDHVVVKHTHYFLQQLPVSCAPDGEEKGTEAEEGCVVWRREGEEEEVHVKHVTTVQHVCWHGKGDYLASLTTTAARCKLLMCPISLS